MSELPQPRFLSTSFSFHKYQGEWMHIPSFQEHCDVLIHVEREEKKKDCSVVIVLFLELLSLCTYMEYAQIKTVLINSHSSYQSSFLLSRWHLSAPFSQVDTCRFAICSHYWVTKEKLIMISDPVKLSSLKLWFWYRKSGQLFENSCL